MTRIQYSTKLQVYRQLAKSFPGKVFVLYGCDASVRGKLKDPDFGRQLAWGEQLLEGYPHAFLTRDEEVSIGRFNALQGVGIGEWIKSLKPQNMLLMQCNYQMDFRAILAAKFSGCKVWIRHETQDEAFVRSNLKGAARAIYYRILYRFIDGALACGKANRSHLLRHGMKEKRTGSALYCVPDPILKMSKPDRDRDRNHLRAQWDCPEDKKVILFCGKLIPKKNPELICEALALLPKNERRRYLAVFVGSGPLEKRLRQLCEQHCLASVFTGFVNQTDLAAHYLAADVMVLPSRRMGETWGLVVNEALQAGCAVALSDAVGSHWEFGAWERVAVFPDENAVALKEALIRLATFPRAYDWCRPAIEAYSVESNATGIADTIFKSHFKEAKDL